MRTITNRRQRRLPKHCHHKPSGRGYIRIPGFKMVYRGHSSPRSARRYLKDSAALQVSQANADLLDLAYGVPARDWREAWPPSK